MAGQLKEVRTRIKSVQNTQQITKAMKMVSAAKLRKAQEGIHQMRPYAKKLQEVLSNIVSSSDGEMGMSLATERPAENILLIVITSDRGLCGAYNTIIVSNQNNRLVVLFSFSFCHKMRKSKAKNIPLHPVKKINNGRPVKRSA